MKIPETEYWKVILYRGCGLTQEHIAFGFDVDPTTISRILRKIKARMFDEFGGDPLTTLLYYVSIKDDE